MAAKITIATAPCSWGVWYADGRPSGTAWQVFLDGAFKAGYKSLELGPDGYLPKDNKELTAELLSRNMSVCAGTACVKLDQCRSFEELKMQIEGLCSRIAALNVQYLVAMDESDVGDYSEKKASFDANTWRTYFTMIKDMRHWTKDCWNIETVFHPHIKTLIETEEEILNLLDFCDIQLCFDTGHHVYVNGDSSAIDFIKKYSSRIAYYHFKNVDAVIRKKVRDENLSSDAAFGLDVMCGLDKGIIDFSELKQILDEKQFEGIGVIEMDMPNAQADAAFEAAKQNLNFLRHIGMIQ
ncbi:MAG: sugar phosphate isomerase/epimerase [Treponema sp.]|nr:sugar phosphate isomerase/epimerase [Treponema sp.]